VLQNDVSTNIVHIIITFKWIISSPPPQNELTVSPMSEQVNSIKWISMDMMAGVQFPVEAGIFFSPQRSDMSSHFLW
jgi:hypothetical protein